MKYKLFRIATIPLSFDKLLNGQFAYFNSYFMITAISSNKKFLKDFSTKENVAYYHINFKRNISPINDLFCLTKLFFILYKNKPSIVHTHTPKAGLIGMLAAKFAKVPIRMHTVAGLPLMETTGFKRSILNLTERITYTCATNVYPNSIQLSKFILENKFTQLDKIKVLSNGSSNGINTSYFNPKIFSENKLLSFKKSLYIRDDDFVFIFVGRLVSHKGINELINVFSELNNKNIKLLLVGPYEHELDPLNKETIYNIENNPNIICVGFQNDVRQFFAISHCLVFPSYREGFPNVVMQAGAMGLPSIVTNINGCNEIIKENINGTLILPKSTLDLYNAMFRMVSDIQWRQHLASNARNMIISRYEQKLVWQALLDEYNQLLTSKINKL